MRRESLTAAGSMALAFLATQHHNLHMLLIAMGLGSAGAGLMTNFPVIRRLMLGVALVMTGVTLYGLWRQQRPLRMRVLSGLSTGISLALMAWSIYQFGF